MIHIDEYPSKNEVSFLLAMQGMHKNHALPQFFLHEVMPAAGCAHMTPGDAMFVMQSLKQRGMVHFEKLEDGNGIKHLAFMLTKLGTTYVPVGELLAA